MDTSFGGMTELDVGLLATTLRAARGARISKRLRALCGTCFAGHSRSVRPLPKGKSP